MKLILEMKEQKREIERKREKYRQRKRKDFTSVTKCDG